MIASTKPPNIIWDAAVTTTAAVNPVFHHQKHDHHPLTVSLPLPTALTTHPGIRATVHICLRYQITTFATSQNGWHDNKAACHGLTMPPDDEAAYRGVAMSVHGPSTHPPVAAW